LDEPRSKRRLIGEFDVQTNIELQVFQDQAFFIEKLLPLIEGTHFKAIA
jgi:hypothetical protein